MGKKIVKYNPAFLSEKDLIDSFVVRYADLELIMQTIRENVTESNQHMMVIGPRGIGKTTLALRAVAEVRKDEELGGKWYPLVFAEESYAVTSAGEFWLEALFHLGQQEKGSKWGETYKELLDESDEDRLADRALAQLLDFADSQGKRLLLVVENFNMMLGDQIANDDCAWKMRKALQHEKRIMLLATATTRFDEMDSPGKAMFDMFRLLNLQPLNEEECREIWNSVTGKELPEERIRPLQILTGGNPRLMTIISSFGKDMSFKELMNELTRLVDDHTEYFKSHLDSLAPVERKVYLALAELWDPSLAKDVAQAARVNVSKASSLLGRLREKGAVVIAEEKGGKKKYQVAERMYNIYYLMRRRGAASRRIKAVVRFMVHFYGKDDLLRAVNRLAEEACKLEANLRKDHYLAYEAIFENIVEESFRQRLLKETTPDFFNQKDTPDSVQSLLKSEKSDEIIANEKKIHEMLDQTKELSMTTEGMQKAKELCQKAIDLKPSTYYSWNLIGLLLMVFEQYEDAESACRKAIELDSTQARGWVGLGVALQNLNRHEEAEKAYREATELEPENIVVWFPFGMFLHEQLHRYEEAEAAYRKAIELKTSDALIWFQFGKLLHNNLNRYKEAKKAYRKALELDPKKADRWIALGRLLNVELNRHKEAEEAYRKAIELEPENSLAWLLFGFLLHRYLHRYDEAEKAYKKTVAIESTLYLGWSLLGELLHENFHCYEEAGKAYRKAIELDPEYFPSWVNLVKLMLDEFKQPLEALTLAEKYLVVNPKNDMALNSFGWAFYEYGDHEFLPKAEEWIREAVKIKPDNGNYQHTLASILCARGKVSESFEVAKVYLDDRKSVKETVDDAIELFVDLAARGHAKEAVEILCDSPSADVLEPLVVGLRLFIGEDVSAAAEILEVGKDVAKKVEERCKEK